MKVFILSSNSYTESGIDNTTSVFSTMEKAKRAFKNAINDVDGCFPDFMNNKGSYDVDGDIVTDLIVRDDWYWWSLTIEEKEVE